MATHMMSGVILGCDHTCLHHLPLEVLLEGPRDWQRTKCGTNSPFTDDRDLQQDGSNMIGEESNIGSAQELRRPPFLAETLDTSTTASSQLANLAYETKDNGLMVSSPSLVKISASFLHNDESLPLVFCQ